MRAYAQTTRVSARQMEHSLSSLQNIEKDNLDVQTNTRLSKVRFRRQKVVLIRRKLRETFSAEETYKIGEQMGREAKAGDVLCLVGDLGVGKTVFTQGFAAGLGITEPVSSPTFTIVQTYDEGRMPFYHFDVYRIGDVEEMEEIGFDEYIFGEGVCRERWLV